MSLLLVLASLTPFASAHADGGKAPDPCFGDSFGAVDGQLVMCQRADKSGDTCWRYAGPKGAPTPTKSPPAPPAASAATVKTDHGKLSACVDTSCVPLGPKAADAYKSAKDLLERNKESTAGLVQLSTDHLVATIARQAWSLAGDVELAIKTPPGVQESLQGATLVGNWVIPEWSVPEGIPCTGNRCSSSVVVSTSGKVIGKPFPGGVVIVMDDHQIAVVSPTAQKVTLIDRDTGAVRGQTTITSPGPGSGGPMVKLDASNLVVIWSPYSGATHYLSWVATTPTKGPKTLGTRKIATCPP